MKGWDLKRVIECLFVAIAVSLAYSELPSDDADDISVLCGSIVEHHRLGKKSNYMEKVTQICNDLDDPIEYSLFASIGVDYFKNKCPLNGIHTRMPSKIVCIWTGRP